MEILKINIIPAKFIEKCDDKYIIKCLIQSKPEITQDRIFDSYSLEGIINPNLVFIGIMSGVGMMQINFCDANEFEKTFKKKWKILLK